MPSIGPMALIIVLVLALLILGPERLPDTGRSLGRGMREFKHSLRGADARALLQVDPTATACSWSGFCGPPANSPAGADPYRAWPPNR